MDRDRVGSGEAAEERRHLPAALPWCVEREGEDVDRPRLGVEGVAGVEERRLAGRTEPDADIGDPRDLLVDEGVGLADGLDAHLPHRHLPAVVSGRLEAEPGQDRHALRVAPDGDSVVGPRELGEPDGVEVVRVLVRDEDGVEVEQSEEVAGEGPRVDEDPAALRYLAELNLRPGAEVTLTPGSAPELPMSTMSL